MAGDQGRTFQRVMEGFLRVADAPEAQRAQILDEVSCGEPSVRAQILAMLQADSAKTGIGVEIGQKLNHLGAGAQLLADAIHVDEARQIVERPRVLSDRYRILGLVGEGGMGMVYEAMQVYPPRKVALKALRPGLQSRSLIRRFAHEAAVLARLQHPGIAQVYDAGASDPQSPDQAFIVMEFVDGKPIIEHARSAGLDVNERVRLMALVCDAVQHAHQRGVIHRDLKPSNVMVDATGQPKVLDFGVARLKSDESAITTMHTVDGQMVGTLGYMSPEQVDGEANKIDATTDVYALGVMLYELLADRPAFLLHGKPMAEAARLVKTLTPPPLSSIAQGCRGDLETIVATAMHREQARRYHSAAAFANDLRRYLGGEAIEARRDSSLYLLQKSLVRYRWAVRAGIAAVIGFASFGVYWARQAVKERELAASEVAAREKATTALDVAERRRQQVDDLSRRLQLELVSSKLERARLEAELGKGSSAEAIVWTELLADPSSPAPWWSMRELYGRFPCVLETGSIENATCMTLDAHDRIIAIGSNKGVLAILSSHEGTILATAQTPRNESIQSIILSEDAATLTVGCFAGTLVTFAIPPEIIEAAAQTRATRPAQDQPPPQLARVRTVEAGVGYPLVIAHDPAISHIVVAGSLGEFRVLNASTLDEITRWTGPPGTVSAMALDGAGRVAIATRDGSLAIRYVHDGSPAEELSRVTEAPVALAFSRDGASVLVGTRDRSILQWRRGEREVSTLTTGLSGLVRACDPSPDGTRFVLAAGTNLQIAAHEQFANPRHIGYHLGGILCARWVGNDALVSLSYNGTVKRWLTTRWPMVQPHFTAGVWQLDLVEADLSDRTLLISADMTGAVIAIDAHSGQLAWRRQLGRQRFGREVGIYRARTAAAASRAGTTFIYIGLGDGTVRILDARDGDELGGFEIGALDVSDLEVNHAATVLACQDSSQTVSLWDLSDPRRPVPLEREVRIDPLNVAEAARPHSPFDPPHTRTEPVRVGVPTATQYDRSLAFSPDDRVLYIGLERAVQMLDATTLEPIAAIATAATVRSVATTPQGLVLAGLSNAHLLLLDRSPAQAPRQSAQTSHVSVATVAINHDATLVAAGGDDGSISIWSRSDMRLLCTIPLGMGEVCAMHFIDRRDRLAVATRRGVVVVDPYRMDAAIAGSLDRVLDGVLAPGDPKRAQIHHAAKTMLRPQAPDPERPRHVPSASGPLAPPGV